MKKVHQARVLPALLVLALAPWTSACAAPQEAPPKHPVEGPGLLSISPQDFQAHVDFLASDELEGRYAKSPQGKQAAEYIATQFKAYGLKPMGDEQSFFQDVPGFSPNVVGVIPGTGPGYLLLSAHYDHLRPKKKGEDRIYNGADDNASGCAAVLELAQAFSLDKDKPSASLVFLGFTAEEGGLRGSKYFVKHAPMALTEMLGVFNMDMISRGKKNLIFCEGGPKAPMLLSAVEHANQRIQLDVRYGEHPEWIQQSDQYSFIEKGVHALYFGVEDHEDYHQVTDHADKILADLGAKVAQLVYLASRELAFSN